MPLTEITLGDQTIRYDREAAAEIYSPRYSASSVSIPIKNRKRSPTDHWATDCTTRLALFRVLRGPSEMDSQRNAMTTPSRASHPNATSKYDRPPNSMDFCPITVPPRTS
jgi:hypothetical protein